MLLNNYDKLMCNYNEIEGLNSKKIKSGSQIKRQTCLKIAEKSNLGIGELRALVFCGERDQVACALHSLA